MNSHRDVAQLVARVVRDDEVVGSNPAIPTNQDILWNLVKVNLIRARTTIICRDGNF